VLGWNFFRCLWHLIPVFLAKLTRVIVERLGYTSLMHRKSDYLLTIHRPVKIKAFAQSKKSSPPEGEPYLIAAFCAYIFDRIINRSDTNITAQTAAI